MKIINILSLLTLLIFVSSCGQEGAAVAPSATGSTIQQVKADCNGQACI